MVDYYDFVLGFIPLAFVGLGGGLYAVGLETTIALTVGGLAAVALVGHALFVNGPVDRPSHNGTVERGTIGQTVESVDEASSTVLATEQY